MPKIYIFILIIFQLFSLYASEVKIGVLAFRSKAETLKEWQKTADYLSTSITGEHFSILPMNYPELREATKNGSIDFIITNSGHYVYLEHLYDISRIATLMKYRDGIWIERFGGVVFVRNNRTDINTLGDLSGKNISAVDQDSLGGYAAPMYALKKNGVNLNSLHITYTGMPHDNVVLRVLSKDADAGFVRSDVLENMAKEGKIDLHAIRILHPMAFEKFPYRVSTDLYPEWPIARMPNTSLELANKVIIALLSQNHPSPKEGDIKWTAPMEYQQIHDVFRTLNLPPYDFNEHFTLIDIYKKFKIFIIIIGFLLVFIVIGVIKEFQRQKILRNILANQLHQQAQTQLAALVFEHSSDAIVIADQKNNIISVNPAFELLTGYTLREIEGQKTNLLHSGKHTNEFYHQMWDAINTNSFWEGEIVDRHKSGSIFSKWLTIRSIHDEHNQPYRYIAIFSEINDSEEAKKTIWYQANFDALTGLPNRSMFMYRLEKELQDIERSQMPMALMFLDLDHFKEINDTLGHDQGDILLQEAARRISLCVRKSDIVARMGGDEFTIIITQLSNANIIDTIANAILTELSHAFKLNGEMVFVSASIGITIAPTDAIQVETLFINADQAMYAAKKDGRNRYRYFMASMQENIQKRMKLINQLRYALETEQFVLYYQPILDVKSSRVHKAEALIRWQKPDGTIISPADFIPIAEETGMIVEIGAWVFKEAIERVNEWRKKYDPSFQISVNKSPIQFRDDSTERMMLIDYINNEIVSSDAIVVEITEGLLMEQTPLVQERLMQLQKQGILLSLDDFGTGYSSLSYLKKFDIDFLKIDQSFVKNLQYDANDKILCEAIIVMAHKLGIAVIAEGVELQEQADFLISVGCDYLQGYLISKPIPAETFEKIFFKEENNR
ncbi:MAG: EAL domain-containing protein [Sulfuricurvum sp.]|nr:EAL domain-containing protein [Sulfuricurvum sp.]